MKWKNQILNLPPYKPGKSIDEVKREYGLSNIVKLASNENPYGCSDNVLQALQNVSSPLALYPDGYATTLRNSLADHLKVNPEQLIFGNGSDEIILIIARSLLRPGSNTVMASLTFPQYKHNAIIEGAQVREVPLINGAHDLKGMVEAIDQNTKVVWLCSPNNPTGVYISNDLLLGFLEQVPDDVLVVLDEAYYEYVVAEDYYDALSLIRTYSNIIVLRTFSKIYGLASLRIGYGMGQPSLIAALEPVREPFNVNTFAQVAAISGLEDQAFVEGCKLKNREGLEQFYQFCAENQLDYYPSQGNFILIDFKVQGNEVFQFLLEKGYIVRSGNALGYPTSVRITVGSKEQNDGVLSELSQFLKAKTTSL